MTRGRVLTLAGAIGLLVGALLPWIVFTQGDQTVGTRGAGWIGSVFVGVAVLVVIYALVRRGRRGKRYMPVGALLAVPIAAIACLNGTFLLAAESVGIDEPWANPGVGQCMTIISATLLLLGGLVVDRE